MSERIDRGIGGSRLILPLIIVLVVAVVAGLYFRSRMDGPGPPAQAEQGQEIAESSESAVDALVEIMLFHPSSRALVVEPVELERLPDMQLQARASVAALLAHKRTGITAVLKDIRLAALYLDSSGSAYVDVSPVGKRKYVRGSVWQELLAIYAIVDTLTQNFDEIKEVHFLVNGKKAETLAGHIDLSGFFRARMDLVRR